MDLLVTNIQRFSVHDGPGIRTTVFFKGCPLNCAWCHNPETKSTYNEILYNESLCLHCGLCVAACPSGAQILNEAGRHIFKVSRCQKCLHCAGVCPSGAIERAGKVSSLAEIIAEVKKDTAFYGQQGGLTLSGGEPLMQMEASLGLLRLAKAANITTAVETCGYFDPSYLEQLAGLVDWFLWDCKDTISSRHREYTGVGNEKILKNLFTLDKLNVKIILRCIIVAGVNTDESHVRGLSGLYHQLHSCIGLELMPYHSYGGSKHKALGLHDNGNAEWIPSQKQLAGIKDKLASRGVRLL